MTNMRDSVTAPRIEAIEAFGFTERQARFLVTVMVYSGAFLSASTAPSRASHMGRRRRLHPQAHRPERRDRDHSSRASSWPAFTALRRSTTIGG